MAFVKREMSCFDPVTTSSYSTMVPPLAPADFATMLDTLVALQPLLSQAGLGNLPLSTSNPSVSQATLDGLQQPPLNLPLITVPLSSMSLASPTSTVSSMAPGTQTFAPSFSPLGLSMPTLSTEQLNSYGLGSSLASNRGLLGFIPPLPESSSNRLSPLPAAAQLRRQSAPETHLLLRPTPTHERRRYSDFSVESLLNQHSFPQMAGFFDQRRGSGGAAAGGGRKQRTIYGSRQTEVLEEAFHTQKYMVGTERELLAARLGLTEAQVRVWFQNRRSKQRKLNRLEEERKQGDEPTTQAQATESGSQL